eukprot:9371362-Alexandrium_andersonii.AAC.1
MSASLVGSEMCIRDRLWKSKAWGYLLGKFPQVDRLLDWAEKQLEPIGAGSQQTAARLVPGFDVAQVSGVPYSA